MNTPPAILAQIAADPALARCDTVAGLIRAATLSTTRHPRRSKPAQGHLGRHLWRHVSRVPRRPRLSSAGLPGLTLTLKSMTRTQCPPLPPKAVRKAERKLCKEFGWGGNLVLAAKRDFYEIALRAIRRGDPWREIYACGRLVNLNDRGRAMLPKLP